MPVLSVSKYFWKSQNLGQEDSDGNSKLVEGSECAPDIRRGYLGQVERCQSRVQTYVDTKYGMFKQIMKRPSQEQTLNKLFFFLNKKRTFLNYLWRKCWCLLLHYMVNPITALWTNRWLLAMKFSYFFFKDIEQHMVLKWRELLSFTWAFYRK